MALGQREVGAALRPGLLWLADVASEWVCDYGESVPRVLRAFLVVLVGFAVVYWLSGCLEPREAASATAASAARLRTVDHLLFSLDSMTTVGTSEVELKPNGQFRGAAVQHPDRGGNGPAWFVRVRAGRQDAELIRRRHHRNLPASLGVRLPGHPRPKLCPACALRRWQAAAGIKVSAVPAHLAAAQPRQTGRSLPACPGRRHRGPRPAHRAAPRHADGARSRRPRRAQPQAWRPDHRHGPRRASHPAEAARPVQQLRRAGRIPADGRPPREPPV